MLTPNADQTRPFPNSSRPIFVQAMWRAGSTYVWKKFREQHGYRAYYEPLHECLVKTQEQVQALCGPGARAALRHPPVDDFYCAEFPFTPGGGVEYFRKSLSYECYSLQETEKDEDLRCYVSNLIEHAAQHKKQAVLQFNRGLLRAGWLAHNFAPVQILVLRHPLSVWKSFATFEGLPFDTNVFAILGQNRQKFPLKHLPPWLEVPCKVSDTFDEEFNFYNAFVMKNREKLYPSFFDFYLLSVVHCAQFADCILDLDELSANPAARKTASARLNELGIEMSLDDCTLPSYGREESDDEWEAYEHFSLGYLARTLPPEISISKEKFELFSPSLGAYFKELFAGFTERHTPSAPLQVTAELGGADEKHALGVSLFEGCRFQAAANLLGSALADRQTGELWNDWATAQNACRRPHLAELGFRLALRSDPPDHEAPGNLGALLLARGKFREALPLLEGAELEAGEETRPILSRLVNHARESLGFCARQTEQSLVQADPVQHRGVTIFLTGLSGAGKSTIAEALRTRLLAQDGRPITLLDGDLVRKHLSSELGFSREHRDINVRRIGFVAAQVARNGGIAICACIAPYDAARKEVRAMIEPVGGFLLVHVATPLNVCEQRDHKGLYAKARAGVLPQFTGISDPYENPNDAEITIDSTRVSPERATEAILRLLVRQGYLAETSVSAHEDALIAR